MGDFLNREYGYVYGIQSLELIKVGVAGDIEQRMEAMRALNPHGCKLIFYRKSYAPYTLEKQMHRFLADKAVGREWFRASLADVQNAARIARTETARIERGHLRKFRIAVAKREKKVLTVSDFEPIIKQNQEVTA